MENPKAVPRPTSRPRSRSPSPNDEGREDASQRKPNVRKRTKTGCLTCRKRRIKCDEAKPTCKNCIKSRRHCDGYNQRVIFKEPIGSFSAPFNSTTFAVGSSHVMEDALSNHHDGPSSRMPLQAIAPRPPSFDFNQPIHFAYRQENVPPYQLPFHAEQLMNMSVFHKSSPPTHYPPTYSQIPNHFIASENQPPSSSRDSLRQRPKSGFSAFVSENQHAGEGPSTAMVLANANATMYSQPNILTHLDEIHHHDDQRAQLFLSENDDAGDELSNIITIRNAFPMAPHTARTAYPVATIIPPPDEPDEDRSMPDSDDDYQNAQNIVAPAMIHGIQNQGATEVRTFGAYADNWAVSAYLDHPNIPEFWHVGLRDIFMHFVNVTGAIITLFEPRAFDQDLPGTEHIAGHALWRTAFPKMALRHPALLQSMLALASIQLAKLQNYTSAAALKHYHLALRRLGKIMQSEMRRKHPATLAATMLLGFFEVWTADHTKWSQHLWGTRILFQEIPLKKMAKLCLPTKRWRQLSQQRRQINSFFPGLMTGSQANSNVLDYELLSVLTGTLVTPEDYGDITPQNWDANRFRASDKDLETFELYSDLFWWYCKMDVYQSFLGGTKLFMEYKHWTQCPPRSNSGTTFGTYDHLVLLLGRLADFAFKDRTRKRKFAESRAGGAANRSPQMFPGMLPVKGDIRGPTGFNMPRETSPTSDNNEEFDAQGSLQNALREWESIRQAFEYFKNHLAPEYGKLDTGYGDLQDTPFGPAVQYRSYAIAGIWMNYYLGIINLYRSHPEMPPASLQAAGLQAAKTRDYALEIGRIAAGTALDLSEVVEINTLLASVLIESCFCLFAAGVQFRDAAQRQWMVQRMFDVSRLTGWQTASQIAGGCESAWIKAFEMQVGPPYARSALFKSKSIWDNPRRIDQRIHELAPGENEPLVLANADRANYALGLLGVEADLQVLELED